MNQQDELGARIAGLLAEGADELPPESRERLRAARQKALARRAARERVPAWVPSWMLAGANGLAGLTERSVWGVRYLIPVAALVLGLLGVVYMHTGTVATDIAEIDVGLLTDELPINAFLDQGLDSWLKRSPR